jgi:hypothetical protein
MNSMMKKTHLSAVVCLAILAAGSSASAGVVLLNENFESSTAGSSVVLPWTWSVETFADNGGAPGGYIGGFYPGDNASPGIQVIVDGQSGAQGANALKVYGDYGYEPNHANNQWVRTSVYQNKTLTPADRADGSLMFTFDYAAFVGEGGIDSTTIAYAYFQILSPNYSETWARQEWAITSADTTFQSGQLWYDVSDPGLDGAQLQWGFATLTQNYSPSAILVDNLQVIPEPSSVILGGLGVALLALRRRKH